VPPSSVQSVSKVKTRTEKPKRIDLQRSKYPKKQRKNNYLAPMPLTTYARLQSWQVLLCWKASAVAAFSDSVM
jgi:hypothetical protein